MGNGDGVLFVLIVRGNIMEQTTPEEANYWAVKHTIEDQFKKDSSNWNDATLKHFGATSETIKKLRSEETFEKGETKFLPEGEVRLSVGTTYEKIMEVIGRYMDMPEEYIRLVAIWILGTYVHETFNTFPYLFINAMRGSGKTRLLKIIACLSRGGNNQIQTGISEAVFFRTPKHKTLILDECEGIGSKDQQRLREYMNASYKRGSTVPRTKKVK